MTDASTLHAETPVPVALVTGASGALGRVIVQRLAEEGWTVGVHHHRHEPSDLLAWLRERDVPHVAVTGDLGEPDIAGACVDAVVRALGPISLVVDNAADQSVVPLGDLTAEDWEAMLRASFLSAVHVTSRATATMPSGGSVVTIASVEALAAFPAHAHYAAAKAALVSYTRALALDLGPRGIRANAVAPGLIMREGLEREWPQGLAWWRAVAPLGRPVTAHEVADAVLFLAGSGASGISGAVLPVDGGWSASARAPF